MTHPDAALKLTPESRWLLPALLMCSMLTVMAGATISPSLPALNDHFASTPGAELLVRLVLTAPGFAIACCALGAGWLADRFGRRHLLIAGVVLYVLAGASGLVLDSLGAIVIGRIMLGVAVGLVMPSAVALVSDHFHGAARDRAMGLQASAMSGGGVVFLLAGGLLATLHWRAPFAIYLLPVLILPLVWRVVHDVDPEISAAHRHADRHATQAVPRAFVARIYTYAFCGMIIFYLLPIHMPFHLREIGVMSPMWAGACVAGAMVASALMSYRFAWLRQRIGPRQVLMLSLLLQALGYAVIGFFGTAWSAGLGAAIAGTGLGIQMPNLGAWVHANVPAATRGRISGGYTTVIFLGQFVSPLVYTPMVKAYGSAGTYLLAGLASVLLAGLARWIMPQALHLTDNS